MTNFRWDKATPRVFTPARPSLPWRDMLDVCIRHPHLLTAWERKFCASLAKWEGGPSAKQQATLTRVYSKVVQPTGEVAARARDRARLREVED